MDLLTPDQTEKKHSIESKLLASSIARDNESDGKLRKNSSDSESAASAVKTKPQQSSGDLIRIFGGNNYEISDSDMDSEEEGEEGVEEEQGEEEKKKETKLNIFKGGLAKKIVTLTEEKKGGRIGQLFRLVSYKEFSTHKNKLGISKL